MGKLEFPHKHYFLFATKCLMILQILSKVSRLINHHIFVPLNILKIFKYHISDPMAEIVNQSFLKGAFSSKLKVVKVVPVFK